MRALRRILSTLKQLKKPKLAASFIVLCAAVYYIYYYTDEYLLLAMMPFLLLGSARGKHPLVLIALAVAPGLFLFFLSAMKEYFTGLSLVAFDQYFLRENLLILAYNDYRILGGLILLVAVVAYYFKILLSGRGLFTRFEKSSASVVGLASALCLFTLNNQEFDFWSWEGDMEKPSVKTFVKSLTVPGAQLILPKSAEGMPTVTLGPLGAPKHGKPNLVFILQESTFDPRLIDPEHKPHTLFAPDAPYGGPLNVHTYGGGTWLTEFSLVTQERPQEFGNGGLYVFHQLEGRIKRSLFTQLKELGYKTVVIYPTPGNFINGRHFYQSIGVEDFQDPVTMGFSKGWNWKIPDSKFYEGVKRKLAEYGDEPVVLLVLTIYQHGPHDPFDPKSDYLERFDQSDNAYRDFLEDLKKSGKPTGVVTFGDHQPDFTQKFFPDDDIRNITGYDMRCVNFSCANEGRKGAHEQIDITLLAPVALQTFGFKLDPLSEYQIFVFDRCRKNVAACSEDQRLIYNHAYSAVIN
jgi:hypothetical protein